MSGPALGRPAESREDLVVYFREGETRRSDWRVGTEHEKIGLLGDTLTRVPYEGERGIGEILTRLARRDAWLPIYEGENVIALEKGVASVTLEPGGQVELSGAPVRTIHETCAEFHAHLSLLKEVSEPLGVVWLGLGVDPLHRVEDIPRVPKARYRIMREYLPERGDLALDMMHTTATVQANFDYSDEADMSRKLLTALAVTPIVSAIYANSSLSAGKPNGFVSKRIHIWTRTDPDRCGLPDWAFRGELGYEDYLEWALDVPMFFLVRAGEYLPVGGISFRRFLAEGFRGHRPVLSDWDLHLTTLFPEVRLKRFIEVRGADAVPPALTCSLPALWKGLLYDDDALGAAGRLVAHWDRAARFEALEAVARRGLAAEVSGEPVSVLARELVAISLEGLRRQAESGRPGVDERGFLEPVSEQVALGKSPGQVVLERWETEWGRSPQRLIEYARY